MRSLIPHNPPLFPETLLLVENNPDEQELTVLAFENNQILTNIVVIDNGIEALDYLFRRGPYANRDPNQMPRLILLDLKLPGVNGLEVLRQIRDRDCTKLIPVVVLTTSLDPQDLINSYQLGCNSYIRKPVNFSEFQETVRQLGLYWLHLNEAPPPSPSF